MQEVERGLSSTHVTHLLEIYPKEIYQFLQMPFLNSSWMISENAEYHTFLLACQLHKQFCTMRNTNLFDIPC